MQKSFLQETRNAQIIDILQSTKAYLAAVIAFVLTPSSSQLRKLFPVGQLCLFNWKRVLKFVEIRLNVDFVPTNEYNTISEGRLDLTVVFYESLPHSATDPATHYYVFTHVTIGFSTHSYPVPHLSPCILCSCPTFYLCADARHYYYYPLIIDAS